MEERNLIANVVSVTANMFQVPHDGIKGRNMSRVFTDARYLAMYISHEKGEYTFRIAEFFGVTPQAVSAGINRTSERLKIYAALRERHDGIVRILDNSL